MDPSAPLLKSQSLTTLASVAYIKNVLYCEAMGLLMYASMGTCPDITFATSMVAQYLENPGWEHWEAVKRIFCYLKGTKDLKLIFGDETLDLVGFVDADSSWENFSRLVFNESLSIWRASIKTEWMQFRHFVLVSALDKKTRSQGTAEAWIGR